MPKVSQLPPDAAPTTSDYVVGNQASGPSTVRFLFSQLISLFWTLANIPTGATSPITRDNESQFPFVASGLVWTGDSYGTNRNASMTAGVVYINGRRISVGAVTARTFTASKDTYIDVLDNGDGTGTLVYTEVTNNTASPSLAANSLRIGIIITGASSIANSGSVNQGQETALLPIVSSTPYAVTDSLGNLICPRDPNRRLIGYRQITAVVSVAATSSGQATGLSVPIIAPTGRKIKLTAFVDSLNNATTTNNFLEIWDGTVGSGTQVAQGEMFNSQSNGNEFVMASALITPSAASKTYNVGIRTNAGTVSIVASSVKPAYLMVEPE